MSDRVLGTMVTYGFPDIDLQAELAIATRIGARVVEILPEWSRLPDPGLLRAQIADHHLSIHSAHGCWGHRTIRAQRVDLGSTDPAVARESIEDIQRCVDWLSTVGGTYLVVHPGGLSDKSDLAVRRAALRETLFELGEHARTAEIFICVENMPPGVHPGSSMSELFEIVDELDHPAVALALDTGHANLTSNVGQETRACGARLVTTHVHDNDGRRDSHEPPGHGTIDWNQWGKALDNIGYRGPVMLECIRRLRQDPTLFRREALRELGVFACTDETC
jgi:sugar phosphate isomerase/epimerase